MPKDEMLHNLELSRDSLIAAEVLKQLEGFSSENVSDVDRANLALLLELIQAEIDEEVEYVRKVGEGVDSKHLRASLRWLPFGKMSKTEAADTELVEARFELKQLIKQIIDESKNLKVAPLAGHLIAMANYFNATTPSDIAHIRWLIVILSLLLYLIKACKLTHDNSNLWSRQAAAEKRFENFFKLLGKLFPETPQPHYPTQDFEPRSGQRHTP